MTSFCYRIAGLLAVHRTLSKQGCVVETASDGQECLDLLLKQGRRYDLITLDNFMPNVSGMFYPSSWQNVRVLMYLYRRRSSARTA